MGWRRTSFKFYAEITLRHCCVFGSAGGSSWAGSCCGSTAHVVKPQVSLLVGLGPLVLSLAPCWYVHGSISLLVSTLARSKPCFHNYFLYENKWKWQGLRFLRICSCGALVWCCSAWTVWVELILSLGNCEPVKWAVYATDGKLWYQSIVRPKGLARPGEPSLPWGHWWG